MTLPHPTETLARAASALVHEHDVAELLLRLTRDATSLSQGDVGGLLVRTPGADGLELLAATDHVATHLEVYQTQRDEGPCVDVFTTGDAVTAVGEPEIVTRWPTVGRAIVDAGFHSAYAFPLCWHSTVLGGLNIFARRAAPPSPQTRGTAQAFADMLTLVIAQPETLGENEIAENLRRALAGRVTIEQAKGALAHTLGLDMADAYDALLERSRHQRATLTETARAVLQEAQRR
ncbi:GAF and ANTAR domain-containing protein [Isoptericola halotolerans]|uniref:GAF and ANTAR domain-containing protein n=1 Tax=Isoptericola halotolerans TaxID=300560 RepID=UPI00388F16A6